MLQYEEHITALAVAVAQWVFVSASQFGRVAFTSSIPPSWTTADARVAVSRPKL